MFCSPHMPEAGAQRMGGFYERGLGAHDVLWPGDRPPSCVRGRPGRPLHQLLSKQHPIPFCGQGDDEVATGWTRGHRPQGGRWLRDRMSFTNSFVHAWPGACDLVMNLSWSPFSTTGLSQPLSRFFGAGASGSHRRHHGLRLREALSPWRCSAASSDALYSSAILLAPCIEIVVAF